MRLSTGVGFTLLFIGLLLFGVATLPEPIQEDSEDACGIEYEITVTNTTSSTGPQPVDFVSLTLSEQETFRLALLKNGTATVENPMFTNYSRVAYHGTVYTVSSSSVPISDCSSTGIEVGWTLFVFLSSIFAIISGLAVITRSIWNQL